MAASLGVVAIAVVKDEADIIEQFVRHNLAYVGHLFVIDDDSKDGTREILMQLEQEGLRVTLFERQGSHFQQAYLINSLLANLRKNGVTYDYVLPLDADEFLRAPTFDLLGTLKASIPPLHTGWLRSVNFVPLQDEAPGGNLAAQFALGRPEGPSDGSKKIVAPYGLMEKGEISEGNHLLLIGGASAPLAELPTVFLQHLPVRSADQIMAKSLVGSWRLAIKPGRHPDEGRHWDRMAATVRANGYRAPLELRQRLSYDYPALLDEGALPDLAGSPAFEGPALALRYQDLRRSSLARSLDNYVGHLTRMRS